MRLGFLSIAIFTIALEMASTTSGIEDETGTGVFGGGISTPKMRPIRERASSYFPWAIRIRASVSWAGVQETRSILDRQRSAACSHLSRTSASFSAIALSHATKAHLFQ